MSLTLVFFYYCLTHRLSSLLELEGEIGEIPQLSHVTRKYYSNYSVTSPLAVTLPAPGAEPHLSLRSFSHLQTERYTRHKEREERGGARQDVCADKVVSFLNYQVIRQTQTDPDKSDRFYKAVFPSYLR